MSKNIELSKIKSKALVSDIETGRDRKMMPDLYRESVAKNAIRRVIIKKR